MGLLLSGSLLVGCVNASIYHAAAPAEVERRVKAGILDPGSARIVAFKGLILSAANSSGPADPASGDLLVDGMDVGGVNQGQAIAIELPPATYAVSWRDVGDTGAKSPDLPISLATGQIVYLSMDRQMATHQAPLIVGGAIGGIVAGAALENTSDPNYHGPIMQVRTEGAALVETMEIVGTDPAATPWARSPRP